MVYLRRRVADCLKVFQKESLAVTCPLAGASYLNRFKYRFCGEMIYI